jgi:hypothetical protein
MEDSFTTPISSFPVLRSMKYLATMAIFAIVVAVALAPTALAANAHKHTTVTGVNITHGGHINGGHVGGTHYHHHVNIHAVKGTKVIVKAKNPKGPTGVTAY